MSLRGRDRDCNLTFRGKGGNDYMQDKQFEFIAQFNAQAGSDVIPLPITGHEGDYRLPNWDWRKLIWRKIEKRVFDLHCSYTRQPKLGKKGKQKSL